MAGRPKQPLKLLEAKGKKHLTKAEKNDRENSEIHAPSDEIAAPDYLHKSQKEEFNKIAKQLVDLQIFSNLDCDALARYLIARDAFVKYTKMVNGIPGNWEMVNALEKAVGIQDKAFKQCRAAASDLGLTITSRCKLVIPKKEEEKESKWDKYKAGGSSA